MPADYRELTAEELNALAGQDLPERALASLLDAHVAAPTNLTAALDRGNGTNDGPGAGDEISHH